MFQARPSGIRLAVVFVNYGPYHRARAAALQSIPDLETCFLELASAQAIYPWHGSGDEKTITITTLARGRYEQLSKAHIIRALWRHLRVLDPDVVAGCGYSDLPMLFAAAWTRLKRRRYVLMFETNAWDRARPRWQEVPKQAALRAMVDGVFCGGVSHRQYLRQLGVPDSRIWEKYDAVDNQHFARASSAAMSSHGVRQRLGLPDAYFLYVGRFSPEKNLGGLLRAYRAYRAHTDARIGLVMVGDGPERHRLQQLAAQLDLTDIVWPGAKSVDELPAYYALARALVLPSLVEPWGLVVNEAMACGLPVLVSSRAGCAADLVHEGQNGWTFDPGDIAALTHRLRAIETLDESTRASMCATSRRIIANYTPGAWAMNLADCVRAVAGRA